MIKKSYIFSAIFFIFLVIGTGCMNSSKDKATISVNSNSEYVQTFKDLNIGILFDFHFKLPNADKSWVTLWVERYRDGKKESEPLTQLSYGNSPNEVEEGRLGFGMINPNSAESSVFLYGPSVTIPPSMIEKKDKAKTLSTWDYAIGDEEVELEIGESKILAVYRETESNSMSTVDLLDEESINRMIDEDNTVLLLKLKIEEKN